jgi:hypothetical protein
MVAYFSFVSQHLLSLDRKKVKNQINHIFLVFASHLIAQQIPRWSGYSDLLSKIADANTPANISSYHLPMWLKQCG